MADNDPHSSVKRKRGGEEDHLTTSTHAPSPVLGLVVPPINYLINPSKKLHLISGNLDAFQEILGLIDQYNGVLHRNESLAGSLGANLVGSLVLKSVEKLFEGPIKVVGNPHTVSAITWLDIIEVARHNPRAFTMMNGDQRLGVRYCNVRVKDANVEISEDDYRLILSGAPERMLPSQPVPEDEVAESATIDIMEQRLRQVIGAADDVAAKARIVERVLQKRRKAIKSRQTGNVANSNLYTSQSPFQPANSDGPSQDQNFRQELLRQFSIAEHKPHRSGDRRGSTTQPERIRESSEGSNNGRFKSSNIDGGFGGPLRSAMMAKADKLKQGSIIDPPCDRCRRLEIDCIKHLTACLGCTKKHARCQWQRVTEDEKATIEHIIDNNSDNQASIATSKSPPLFGHQIYGMSGENSPNAPKPQGMSYHYTPSSNGPHNLPLDPNFALRGATSKLAGNGINGNSFANVDPSLSSAAPTKQGGEITVAEPFFPNDAAAEYFFRKSSAVKDGQGTDSGP